MRNEKVFNEVLRICENWLPKIESPKRKRKTPKILNNYILAESSGTYIDVEDRISLLRTFYEIIDISESVMELDLKKNYELIKDISNISQLNYDDFKVFKDLNINIPLKEEIICVKNYLKENNIFFNNDMLIELYKQRNLKKYLKWQLQLNWKSIKPINEA